MSFFSEQEDPELRALRDYIKKIAWAIGSPKDEDRLDEVVPLILASYRERTERADKRVEELKREKAVLTGELPGKLRGAQALADEKVRCFLVRAEAAEAKLVNERACQDCREFREMMEAKLAEAEVQRDQARNLLEIKCAQLREADAEVERLFERLEAKTLHRLVCNADQSKPTGGDMCICNPLKAEVKRLREVLSGVAVPAAVWRDLAALRGGGE